MEPAPLPPHERTWRHPSEVGPSRIEIAADGHGRPVLLAAGAMAALMVVVMIVAMTPRPGAGPEAISATTRPATVATASTSTDEPQGVAAGRTARLASFAPIPNAIAAAPVARQNTMVVARSLPLDDEPVLVKTDHVTYRLGWSDVEFLGLGDRAVVLNDRGELVARIVEGDVVVLVD